MIIIYTKKNIFYVYNDENISYSQDEDIESSESNSILDVKGTYIKCFDNTTYVLYVLMDLAERDWEMEITERQKRKKYYNEDELIAILKQLSNALYILQGYQT